LAAATKPLPNGTEVEHEIPPDGEKNHWSLRQQVPGSRGSGGLRGTKTTWRAAKGTQLMRWFGLRPLIGVIERPPMKGLGTVEVQGPPSGPRSPDGGQSARDASGHTSAAERSL